MNRQAVMERVEKAFAGADHTELGVMDMGTSVVLFMHKAGKSWAFRLPVSDEALAKISAQIDNGGYPVD